MVIYSTHEASFDQFYKCIWFESDKSVFKLCYSSRPQNDASKERDESHAGKVVDRHWYEKNKHIFPANRWEVSGPRRWFSRVWGSKRGPAESPVT